MTTIKSYTDLEQSKNLAEFLPLESADMIWILANPDLPMIKAIAYEDSDYNNKYYEILPAWSLAALLELIPNYQLQTQDDGIGILFGYKKGFEECTAECPLDACVAMIEKLHKQKLL